MHWGSEDSNLVAEGDMGIGPLRPPVAGCMLFSSRHYHASKAGSPPLTADHHIQNVGSCCVFMIPLREPC